MDNFFKNEIVYSSEKSIKSLRESRDYKIETAIKYFTLSICIILASVIVFFFVYQLFNSQKVQSIILNLLIQNFMGILMTIFAILGINISKSKSE